VTFAIERLETHALGWGEWSTQTLAALPLGKNTSLAGWIDLSTDLGVLKKRKIYYFYWELNS
jgi:hypothetical protein